jgi:hypothetical protein
MAVYETSKSARYGLTYTPGVARQLVCDTVIVALATAMIDNADDDVGLLWLPKGAVIEGMTVSISDVDSGTAFVIDIGITGTEELILANATTGQATGINVTMAQAAHLYKCTARTQVRMFVSTAAGTPVEGTLKFSIRYFVDPEFSTTALVAST